MPAPGALRLLPLGGLGRIGGNLMLYETAADLVAVDCGVCFPGPDSPGVDWLVPRLDYIEERRDKLRGYFITHGHEDHLGALPWALEQLPAPVYGTALTLALVEHKLAERGMSADLREIEERQVVRCGEIAVEPLAVTHSIPDAVALALHTPVGVVVHTGDFKLESDPLDGRTTDVERLAALGESGVVALLADSTNAQRGGHTWGERRVGEVLARLIAEAPRRVLATTFASNLFRLQSLIDASVAAERRVMPVGRSVRQFIQLGRERGFLRVPARQLVEPEEFRRIPPEKLTVIASGCQAEGYSAFATIARGEHGQVRLTAGDRALLSARRIPGNERTIGKAVDALLRQGIEVIDDRVEQRIHASGHAFADEQRRLIELCAPELFVPIHGERRHLESHAATARDLGVETRLIEEGQPLELSRDGGGLELRAPEPVEAGLLCLDGAEIAPPIVLRDRLILGEHGFVACALHLDPTGREVEEPLLFTRGVLHVDESAELLEAAAAAVTEAVADVEVGAGEEALEEAARLALRRFFRQTLGRRPMLLTSLTIVED